MTLVIFDPQRPALEFFGHAGAGLRGQDPVCAALSILLFTLIDALPDARVSSGDGWCCVDAGEHENPIEARRQRARLGMEAGGSTAQLSPDLVFSVVLRGLRLLAGAYPRYVRVVTRETKHETGNS